MTNQHHPPSLGATLRLCGSWLWVQRAPCRCDKAIPLAPFVFTMGLDAPLPAILTKMRCTTCGEHPATLRLPTSDGIDKARPPIPLERVPSALRDWAKVDLFHIPAPLRAHASTRPGPF